MKRLAPSALVLTALVSLAGCKDPEVARADRVHDMMANVVDPAADAIWLKSGWVVTAEGEKSLFPTDDAGWTAMAESAQRLAKVGEDMKSEKYAPPGEEAWGEYADGIVLAAAEIERAAKAQDQQAVFDSGGILYNVCTGCHQQYIIEPEMEAQAALESGASDGGSGQ